MKADQILKAAELITKNKIINSKACQIHNLNIEFNSLINYECQGLDVKLQIINIEMGFFDKLISVN